MPLARVEKVRHPVEGRMAYRRRRLALMDQTRDGGSVGTIAVSGSFRPEKRADVLELDMGDGVVLYDADSRLVHHLNPTASVVWHLADGSATVDELANEIAEELTLDPVEMREQISGLVAELDALGLVEDIHRQEVA
jgi:PqqD family protein of HPr-rel-A system